MIRGIVFDLDGTLLDSDGAELAALRNFIPHFSLGRVNRSGGRTCKTLPQLGTRQQSVGGNAM